MTRREKAWLLVPQLVELVTPKRVPGVYLLGCSDDTSKTFTPLYVGRSDVDVQRRLLKHEKFWRTTYFQAHPLKSARAAFYHECFYWHVWIGTPNFLNKIHPDRPANENLLCPFCPTTIKKFVHLNRPQTSL